MKNFCFLIHKLFFDNFQFELDHFPVFSQLVFCHVKGMGVIFYWIFENDCYKKSEMLYRHEPWEDGKWHTGPKDVMYAVDFDDPKDAMQFALWIGLGIE